MAGDAELTEEDVFSNDIDPLEGIRQLRKEEASAELEEAAAEEASTKVDNSDDSGTVDDNTDEFDEKTDTETDDDNNDDDDATTDVKADVSADSGNETDAESKDDSDDTGTETETEVSGIDLTEKRKFKANGQEFEFTVDEMLKQFGSVFGQSMDYTQKTQKIAPFRKMISALEEENITEEQLNLLIDASKGNKGAIKQLMDNNKLESYDLSEEDNEQSPYAATQYGSDEQTLNLKEVVDSMSSDPEYTTTVDIVQHQWDSGSQNRLASNPSLLKALHHDVKTGIYANVAPEATKLKILDGNTKSDIEYYMLAGQQLNESKKSEETQADVGKLNKETHAAVTKSDKASSEAKRKRSASSTGSRSDRTVIDYLDDDNDEAFDEWYNKVTSSS